MGARCARERARHRRGWGNGRGFHRDQMAALPTYPGAAGLSAGPIPPADGMRRSDRPAWKWPLFWRGLRQGMQDSAHPTRFLGGGAMRLTVKAEGTGATVRDPGGIEDPHRPIVFGATFLRIQGGSLPTSQRAIRLRKKVLPSQAPCSRCARPLRGTEGWSSRRAVRRCPRFRVRGGQIR
jgi:hypothetical protein